MNRKDVNDIIKALLPVTSSSIIGAPKKRVDMDAYLKVQPKAGVINFYDNLDFSAESAQLPAFFKTHELSLQHSTYTAVLNNARVWGRNGAVIGWGDYFITDVSREFNDDTNIKHSVYYTIKQIKAKLLTGNIAVIGTAGADVYFHWMLDILPRLALISKSIPLSSVDYFITEFTKLSYQTETLDKVGIPVNKIVASNQNSNFHIKAATLWVPSFVGAFLQPNSFQINFLKLLFKDSISSATPFRKLYISRKKTGRRKIVNEEQLLSSLYMYNFETIYCEEMTVEEQIKLFSEALIIICSHGSALTNLVFCKPGTKVLDLFNQSHINACFWFISRIVDLNYNYLCGTSCPIDNNPKNDNTLVDVVKFEKFLQEFEC